MHIAFISDIHGNLPALEAVLKKIKELKLDAVYFLGDAVGYGPWPQECVELLRNNITAGVIGNHDAGATGRIDVSNYYDAVRYVIEWSGDQLKDEDIQFLNRLKYIHVDPGNKFIMSHGSPKMPEFFEYIFNKNGIESLYGVQEYLKEINFVGHAHIVAYFLMVGKRKTVELDLSAGEIALEFSCPSVCVAGAVGQPRDGDARAAFVSYDLDKRIVHIHRVEYDVASVAQKIIDLKLPRSFAERLREGY